MSALTSPRGPLPARVYWVRRLLLLSIVFLLVFGVSRFVPGGDDGDGSTEAAQVVGTSADVEVQATDEDDSGADAAPDGTDDGGTAPEGGRTDAQNGQRDRPRKARKPEPPPLPEPDGPCEAADVVVTPSVPKKITAKGLTIDLEFQTKEADACTWTVSADTVTAKITSGADSIWSSQQCSAAIPDRDIVVRSVESTVVPMVWNLRRSDEGCSVQAQWARLGWYHVATATFGGEPTSVQFQLARSPEKVVGKNKAGNNKKKNAQKPADQRRNQGNRTSRNGGNGGGQNGRNGGGGDNGGGREHRSGDSGGGTPEPNG